MQAQTNKVASLLKCLNAAKTIPAKGEKIAVSFIKLDNFDPEQLQIADLSQVGSGPLSQENTFPPHLWLRLYSIPQKI